MAWYRAGTVALTNGSAVVTGTNTDFVANTQAGEAFLGPDGRVYEVASVTSATQLSIAAVYQGATAAGQGYALMPTSSFARDLALGAAQLLNTFATVRDGVGAGLFPDGSLATPALRFAADQDTGFRRVGANVMALVTGGQDALTVGPYIGIGTGTPIQKLHVNNSSREATFVLVGNNDNGIATGVRDDGFPLVASFTASGFAFGAGFGGVPTEFARFDSGGNFLVGSTTASYHRFAKDVAAGVGVAVIGGMAAPSGYFQAVTASGYNPAACAISAGVNPTTSRSINAGGTINASGADYAEYMVKAAGCGTIAPGDVCGVDVDGRLTKTWANAISFIVKSTDPAYVGGDVWASHLSARPEAPGPEPIAPLAPLMPDTDDETALAPWRDAVAAYPALLASFNTAHGAWQAATTAHATALASWEADLEAARQKVDRIAFAGQVPVNVAGDFAVGDYLVAVASGSGIKAIAVAEADITFAQYRRRLGKVWAIRDGRPWVDVQHG